MNVFSSLGEEYEQVVFGHDAESGLRTIIAVYSTTLGPALGGTRIWPFENEEAAFKDALRLAKAMAFKASAAGLDLGGGKAVIIADSRKDKTEDLLKAYARVVDGMGGSYITTADVGSTMADMDVISSVTRFVTGTSRGSGDPSPVTAYGVLHGLYAVAQELWESQSLRDRHVAVQGIGKVGAALCRYLSEQGARLSISDIDHEAAAKLADEIGAESVSPEHILAVECDILAPCALGPVVTDASLSGFSCRAIAGAANNQLERPDHADALLSRGILYAPDYVINAGGLINVEDELHGYDSERAHVKAAAIKDRLAGIFERAREENTSPALAADRIALDRIRSAKRSG